jgi:hypothetical protein
LIRRRRTRACSSPPAADSPRFMSKKRLNESLKGILV